MMLTGFLCCCQAKTNDDSQSNTQKPILTIGIDITNKPFTYYDDYGKLSGIDVDIATEVCNRMGCVPKFTVINWEDRNKLLETNQIDCFWSGATRRGRSYDYLFSTPYMISVQRILVNNDSELYTFKDLKNKNICVQSDSSALNILIDKQQYLTETFKNLYAVGSLNEVFQFLNQGKVDGVAIDSVSANAYIKENNEKYRLLKERLSTEEVVVGFQLSNTSLCQKVNSKLSEMKEDGALMDILKHWGAEDYISLERLVK